ncbi:MAG: DUF2975 domain-containing protein [Tannerella sp.]|nr:DUF2975 domain-containing protein [Tannerella sp.]
MNMLIKRLPTIILRIIAILSAIAGTLVCIFGVPSFGTEIARIYPEYAFWQYPVCVGLYLAAACFFFVLLHFWLLLNSIDKKGILPVKNLKMIRSGAIMFAILYFIFVIPILFLAVATETEDSNPGIIFIAAFAGMFPIGVAAIASVLERIAGK